MPLGARVWGPVLAVQDLRVRLGGVEVLRVHLGLGKQAGRHSVTRARGASVGDLGYGPGGFRRWRAGRGRGRLGGRGPYHGRGVLDWEAASASPVHFGRLFPC